ncbi:TolB family protein [Micromonospora sp. NPDC050397]|uniref:TolB family protein n=1 Tax=Micromonospora sp. NPDC050397 TaxID=3364279 RepID=UPI00384C8AAC
MNPHVAEAIRNAFEEVAESAPAPTGLAPTALVTARRHRLARRLTGAGTVAAVCAALIGVLAVAAPNGTADPDQVADRMRPQVVTAYSMVRDVTATGSSQSSFYSLLLNFETGRYERMPYQWVLPSPDGSRMLVCSTGDNAPGLTRIGMMDRASGDVRWISEAALGDTGPALTQNFQWSPDGGRILFVPMQRPDRQGFVLFDPETLDATMVPVPDFDPLRNPMPTLVWTSDSGTIAMLQTRVTERPEDTATGVRFYDLTGELTRTVGFSTSVYPFRPVFSPGGDQLALGTIIDRQQSVIIVFDSTTGAVRHRVTPPFDGSVVGWTDNAHLLVRATSPEQGPGQTTSTATPGTEGNSRLLVVDLDGRVDHSVPLSVGEDQTFGQISVGSSDGLPPSAAPITF